MHARHARWIARHTSLRDCALRGARLIRFDHLHDIGFCSRACCRTRCRLGRAERGRMPRDVLGWKGHCPHEPHAQRATHNLVSERSFTRASAWTGGTSGMEPVTAVPVPACADGAVASAGQLRQGTPRPGGNRRRDGVHLEIHSRLGCQGLGFESPKWSHGALPGCVPQAGGGDGGTQRAPGVDR